MKHLLALTITLAACAALAPATSSSATSQPASGGFTLNAINQTFVKAADGNLFFSDHDLADYTGTFNGSHLFDGTIEVLKDGSISFHGTATFTGTVSGCGSGTVVFEVNGAIDPSGLVTRDNFHALSNQGTLPVHATLEPLGYLGTTMAYTGTYDC
jgi:hypothetical protein